MFIDPSRRHNDYDVASHCTPNGVRGLLFLCAMNIATPSGVPISDHCA